MSEAINAVDTAETAVESGFDADGNISDENMAAALTGGTLEVEETTEGAEEPTESQKTSEEPTEPDEKTEEPSGVMSKSGESIIPYADLIKERDGRHAERDRANDLQSQLNALLTKQKDEPLANDSETEEKEDSSLEKLEAMFEDYPESKGILEGLSNSNADLTKQLGELRDQIGKVAETSAASTHFKAINDAHSNAETVLTSDEFKGWIDQMNPIVKGAYEAVYKHGTSDQVISMLNDFTATQKKPEEPKADPKVVDEKVAKAETEAENKQSPGSLSDISGSTSPHDEKTALIDMSQANFMDKMSNLSSSAQMELLDRIM